MPCPFASRAEAEAAARALAEALAEARSGVEEAFTDLAFIHVWSEPVGKQIVTRILSSVAPALEQLERKILEELPEAHPARIEELLRRPEYRLAILQSLFRAGFSIKIGNVVVNSMEELVRLVHKYRVPHLTIYIPPDALRKLLATGRLSLPRVAEPALSIADKIELKIGLPAPAPKTLPKPGETTLPSLKPPEEKLKEKPIEETAGLPKTGGGGPPQVETGTERGLPSTPAPPGAPAPPPLPVGAPLVGVAVAGSRGTGRARVIETVTF